MSIIKTVALASAGLSALALGMTILNELTWPRGKRRGRMPAGRRVSILVPARNEARHIEQCVRAAWSSDHPILEVIVCDDASTDATPEILARLQKEQAAQHAMRRPRLKVIGQERAGSNAELPQGWVGKPYACHRLAKAASGDVLLFVDADTFLDYDGVARLASLFAEHDADVVTAVPRQRALTLAEQLILPLLHVTYTSWFPIFLTWRSQDERFLAANGQLLAITREMYEQVGGHEAIRQEVVDDMELCKLVKRQGGRVVFADGHAMAQCRMYESAREVWEGFSKNIYPGLGASRVALSGVLGLYGVTFVAPYLTLWLAARREGASDKPAKDLGNKTAYIASFASILNNLALRYISASRHDHDRAKAMWLHPIGVTGLLAIALNSARWYEGGGVRWSGRVYGPGDASSQQSTPARHLAQEGGH